MYAFNKFHEPQQLAAKEIYADDDDTALDHGVRVRKGQIESESDGHLGKHKTESTRENSNRIGRRSRENDSPFRAVKELDFSKPPLCSPSSSAKLKSTMKGEKKKSDNPE